MNEKQEQTAKALRRAWREFTDKVNKMGNAQFASVSAKEVEAPGVEFQFFAVVEIAE